MFCYLRGKGFSKYVNVVNENEVKGVTQKKETQVRDEKTVSFSNTLMINQLGTDCSVDSSLSRLENIVDLLLSIC
jgi:hypothetical protein